VLVLVLVLVLVPYAALGVIPGDRPIVFLPRNLAVSVPFGIIIPASALKALKPTDCQIFASNVSRRTIHGRRIDEKRLKALDGRGGKVFPSVHRATLQNHNRTKTARSRELE
jgi:hypothetical protein